MKTYEDWLEAVSISAFALKQVPTQFLDYTMCLAAVKQNSLALCGTPPELRDYRMYKEAVRGNGMALSAIPENERTPEILLLHSLWWGEDADLSTRK